MSKPPFNGVSLDTKRDEAIADVVDTIAKAAYVKPHVTRLSEAGRFTHSGVGPLSTAESPPYGVTS